MKRTFEKFQRWFIVSTTESDCFLGATELEIGFIAVKGVCLEYHEPKAIDYCQLNDGVPEARN